MRLAASDIYTLYRPSRCELRVYLRSQREPESEPGPFEELLRRLGERHEKAHLASFPEFVDLSAVKFEERASRTREAVNQSAPVIYQPLLEATTVLHGIRCEVRGEPDFLIRRDAGPYAVRDSKLSRRINEPHHSEILRQVELYAWLYEQAFGQPPVALEVHSGTGDIVAIPYDGGVAALELLREIVSIKNAQAEPYSPVGWSKCAGCAFHQRCWPAAQANRDVALLAGVDQGLALALRERGTNTIEALLAQFDEARLAEFKRPWGQKTQKVGKNAKFIMPRARAVVSQKEILLASPQIPDGPNYVMFDLEGLPPPLDEVEKIYLWGLQVFGERPGAYQAAAAGFGSGGDREGWEQFLVKASDIFAEYGNLPFVHWSPYEASRLAMYIERYGDPDGIAARVRQSLLDLWDITKKSIALPVYSYSLKEVEKYVGFKRSQKEYGGDWAMAKYVEAIETGDEQSRKEVMDQILAYNQEDLAATWAVLKWLKSYAPSPRSRRGQ